MADERLTICSTVQLYDNNHKAFLGRYGQIYSWVALVRIILIYANDIVVESLCSMGLEAYVFYKFFRELNLNNSTARTIPTCKDLPG